MKLCLYLPFTEASCILCLYPVVLTFHRGQLYPPPLSCCTYLSQRLAVSSTSILLYLPFTEASCILPPLSSCTYLSQRPVVSSSSILFWNNSSNPSLIVAVTLGAPFTGTTGCVKLYHSPFSTNSSQFIHRFISSYKSWKKSNQFCMN